MSREIKFRHWFPSTKVMTAGHSPLTLILTNSGKEDYWKDAVWMQFTGLRDSKGVEIYEGDLIQFMDSPSKHKVFWDAEFGRWGRISNGYEFSSAMASADLYTVVGNIYEHPQIVARPHTGSGT